MPNKNHEDIYNKTREQLYNYINEYKLRHTLERLSILEVVCKLQRFSVEELRDSITKIAISRATIYNALNLFEKAGIIRRIEKEYGVRAGQYELACLKSSSVQIICQNCSRVSEVKDSTILRMLADKKFSNFIPERFSLYIYGKCKTCRSKLLKKQQKKI